MLSGASRYTDPPPPERVMATPDLRPLGRPLPASVTFAVSDVSPTTKPLPEIPYPQAVAAFLDGPVESCSCYHGRLVANVRSHPLVGALHAAFRDHRPVCLSPDIVWLTLAQGLAH